MTTTNNNVYLALLNIEKKLPELFYLIKACEIKPVPENECSSAGVRATKKGFLMLINENWINSFNVHNLSGLIEHELLHIVLDHCGLDKTGLDAKMLNVAQDAIINDLSHYLKDRKMLNNELSQGVYLENINKDYGQNFSVKNTTIKEIYDFLMGKKESNTNGNETSFDQGLSEENNNGQCSITDENGNVIEQSNVSLDDVLSETEKNELLKAYSNKSNEVKQYLKANETREKNAKIKSAIDRFFSSNKNNFKKSIKRPNKRFTSLPYGKIPDKTQRILLALDVSGSMLSPNDIEKMKITINTATKYQYKCDLIHGDTKKIGQTFKNIKKNFDFDNNIKGGGGTDLKFIFDENLNQYDCIVILTDGEFTHADIPLNRKNSILFLNTTENLIPNFKNLFI